jgi:hypothetical protein
MKKLSYAIICSTALVVTAFAPHYADRCVAAGVMFAFAALTVMTNEK